MLPPLHPKSLRDSPPKQTHRQGTDSSDESVGCSDAQQGNGKSGLQVSQTPPSRLSGSGSSHHREYSDDSTIGSVDYKPEVGHGLCFHDDDSSMGSVVFNYQPGSETPPAEYDLPRSIMKVYRNNRQRTDTGGSAASNSSILTAASSDENETDNRCGPGEDSRMLPYNERKKISEQRANVMRRDGVTYDYVSNGDAAAGLPPRHPYAEPPLMGPHVGVLTPVPSEVADSERTMSMLSEPHASNLAQNRTSSEGMTRLKENGGGKAGWFNQFTALMKGQGNRYGSVEHATEKYHKKNQAFLKRTEKKRAMLYQQQKESTLAQVMEPNLPEIDHVRRRTLSYNSTQLESIPSIDTEDGSEASEDIEAQHDEGVEVSVNEAEELRRQLLQEEYQWRIQHLEAENRKLYEWRRDQLERERERLERNVEIGFFALVVAGMSGILIFGIVVCVKFLF